MQPDELTIEYQPRGKSGQITLTVHVGDELLAAETLNVLKPKQRADFVTRLTKDRPGIDTDTVHAQLLRIAGQLVAKPESAETNGEPLESTPEETKSEALAMLHHPALIQHVVDDVARLGVAGEKTLTAMIYIVGTSRLLPNPLACIVQGLTSSGKSFIVDAVAKLFPPEAIVRAHKMTPEALVHMPVGELENRFVVAGERSRRQDDESADATRALREMLSDQRLTKLIAMKGVGGIETVQIDQPGPIAYIESTTLQTILDEDRNRCLVVSTDETPAQTERIIKLLASRKADPVTTDGTTDIVARHHAAQRMLKRCRVVVPFAKRVGELFPHDRTDARRTFGHLLYMIEAVALLHQYQRVAAPGDGIAVEATVDDYRLARRLLAQPFAQALGNGLSDAARRLADRLREHFGEGEFDTRDIARSDGIMGDAQVIRRYVRALACVGVLEQTEPPKGPKPARYRVASVAADDASVAGLPEIDDVFDGSPVRQGVSAVASDV